MPCPHSPPFSRPIARRVALCVGALAAATGALLANPVNPPVATGASIDESTVRVTLYVSAGASGGDGSRQSPLGTLAEAFARAQRHLENGEPTRIAIFAGTYREGPIALDLRHPRARDTLLVVHGENADSVVWKGSDLWPAAGWTDHGDGLFSHPWTERWGHFTYRWGPPETLGHRREMVFIDGRPLRQVLLEIYRYEGHNLGDEPTETNWTYLRSVDPRSALTPGTFGVAEREQRLYVRPEDPDAFAQAEIEVGLRRQLLILADKRNLVVRGITFTHAVNDYRNIRQDGPLTLGRDPRNVLIEDCRFLWNNFDGLPLGGSDITLRRTEASYNGFGGFAHGANNLLLEDCTTNFNNWRGHWGGQRSWNMAGFKFGTLIDRVTIRRHTAIGNLAPGVWSDIHPTNIRVEDSVMALNDRMGLFFELSHGPHLAERCLIVHNRTAQYVTTVAGISEIRDSVLYGESVENSGRHRLPEPVARLSWYPRRSAHARMGRLEPEFARLTDSVLAGGPQQVSLVQFHNGIPRDDARYPRWRLEMSGNLLHPPVNEAFTYNDRGWNVHIVQYPVFARELGLGQNRLADPKFLAPRRLDFRVADDSPLVNRPNLPLRALDPAWIERTREFWDWAGHTGHAIVHPDRRGRVQRDE